MRPMGFAALMLAATAGVGFGQQAISARSGMVHYIEGKVFAGPQQLEDKFGNFPQIKENQVLRTEEGRAEVLLTPGVFLRVAENSSFRMITNRLIDTRLEFLTGSMILESDDVQKDTAVSVVAGDAVVHLRKAGIYRFDSEPAQLRVVKGMLAVEAHEKTFELKEGKLLNLTGEMAIAKFDPNQTDALERWSYRRARDIAVANVSAAKSLRDAGGYRGGIWNAGYYGGMDPCATYRSAWAFNPYFGMYTYVPCTGQMWSPYGFLFWSPVTVYQVYAPRPVYNWGNAGGGYSAERGYSTFAHTSSGYSGAVSAVSSAPAAGGMSASHGPSGGGAVSAGGGGGVSRGGGGGGGGRR